MAVTTRSCASIYDVFLSFRGEDTRLGFTGNLYKALTDKGIHTFIDDEELPRGEEITATLVKAIEESRIAITVLSTNYASSSFCLDELATIFHCKQNKGLLVIPVFYMVDPSDVRHQKGSYGKALAGHEKRFKAKEKLQNWKMALRQVANLSGYHFKDGDGYEYKFIRSIVEQVFRVINRACCIRANYLVGLEPQVAEVKKLLVDGSGDGVCMIGIHGMGGVGKSTLAGAVYNDLIAKNFDGLCFLGNVREKSDTHGLEHLQSILLSEILGQKDINITSWRQGASMIHDRLRGMKVLLVVDDVDKDDQLQAIAGGHDWFGPGSIIIITTRDKQLLASHEIKRAYEVEKLNENDALQLLTWNAFRKEKPDPRYEEVLNHVVAYASGLPLALEVIGSNLFGKSIKEWESAITKYKRIPEKDIIKILKVSFDALGEEEKSVFLDIACCFKGYKVTEVEDILHAIYDDCMIYHIGVLVEKSLIKVSYGTVEMHDLIQEMGRQIDRPRSPEKPGKCKRLWFPKDIIQVLKDNTGTSKIEIICLDFFISDKEETVEWNGNAFKEMENLKILIIRNGKFSKGPNYFPESLRVLEWHGYPSNCFPSNFHPNKLVICKLPNSCFTSFEFHSSSKKFENLTVLNYDECKFLTRIPDVSDLSNLKELSFKECENLTTVHDSVGILAKLKILSAEGCRKLRSFPALNLTSLETLQLSFCSSLEYFPDILGEMKNIWELELIDLPIKELPSSFQNLIGLQWLLLRGCGIVQLRCSIAMMPELFELDIENCNRWQWVKSEEGEGKVGSIVSSKTESFIAIDCNLNDDFFSTGFMWFAHVEDLSLSGNNFTILPECFKELQFLKHLDVSDCKHLREIRGVPPNLESFYARNCISLTSSGTSMLLNQELHEAGQTVFVFPGTSIPEWFDHKSRGPSSSFWFRNKFPAKVLCLLIAPVCSSAYGFVKPMVFINGKVQKNRLYPSDKSAWKLILDHTYLFDLHMLGFENNLFEVALEKEWNHVEITYPTVLARERKEREEGVLESSLIKAIGIHIFKEESSTEEDIRFDDPYSNPKLDDHLSSSESQNHSLLESLGLGTRKFFIGFFLIFFMFFISLFWFEL